MQTREADISFVTPFTLPGLDRTYPPGRYVLRIDEEQLDVSFPAVRRVATVIMLTSGGTTLAWLVDPKDLEAAAAQDLQRAATKG